MAPPTPARLADWYQTVEGVSNYRQKFVIKEAPVPAACDPTALRSAAGVLPKPASGGSRVRK